MISKVFTKSLGVHSRLNLDAQWTEDALTAIRDDSWRVLLKPIAIDGHRFVTRADEGLTCHFEFVEGQLSWDYFRGDYISTIEHHLDLLPRLLRDLSDSSQRLMPSWSHRDMWRESANQAISILSELDAPELTSRLRTILLSSLLQVCTGEIPCETLVHGDFHPGNVMISGSNSIGAVTVIDLENLTVGSFFVDFLYCSTWARLINQQSRYWDLMNYLEFKYARKVSQTDIGLAASLMLNQAHNNAKMTSQRIVLGLLWMVDELTKQYELYQE